MPSKMRLPHGQSNRCAPLQYPDVLGETMPAMVGPIDLVVLATLQIAPAGSLRRCSIVAAEVRSRPSVRRGAADPGCHTEEDQSDHGRDRHDDRRPQQRPLITCNCRVSSNSSRCVPAPPSPRRTPCGGRGAKGQPCRPAAARDSILAAMP